MSSRKKKIWLTIAGVMVALNLWLWSTGKLYYYKALVYNYVNIDDLDLFHTRVIEAGNAQPWSFASSYNQAKLSDTLISTLDQYQSVAYLVVHNDSIVYEAYWDGYSDSSLSNSFSMAKSIISILVGIAHDEGKIKDLDDPVCNYLTEFCNKTNKAITIRHLLMMSSGLNYDEGYSSLTSPVTQSYYGTDLREQMLSLKGVVPPGRDLNYMSCNTQILAFIVEKVAGMKISDYASQKLWRPIGAEHDAQWSLDHKDGNEKAYCCFYSNARDFARIGKLYLQKGKWNGNQIVSEDYVIQSITPAPLNDNGKPNTIYGYQWWLTSYEGRPIFYARGILGQYIFVVPDENLIFVRLGHKRGEKNESGELLDIPVYIAETIKIFGSKNTN
jgi:CubicO group peptidase (beta-lactamase class C family)